MSAASAVTRTSSPAFTFVLFLMCASSVLEMALTVSDPPIARLPPVPATPSAIATSVEVVVVDRTIDAAAPRATTVASSTYALTLFEIRL